ncbi:MAG: ABC transporter substrate-binding protein [Methylobacteriaceae bacterium]|nr:ABC transporter substrate-binding protein [Methylobacteriaceae bacterium]
MASSKTRTIDRRRVVAGAGALIAAPAIVRAEEKALKIAVLLPLTGAFAPDGQSCHRGALASVKVLSDLSYRVELVNYDTESDSEVARARAEKAISDGAKCVVGAFDDGDTLAVARVCEQRKVPLIVNVSSEPEVTSQGFQYVVRNFPVAETLTANGLRLAGEMAKAAGIELKSAALVYPRDLFGAAQARAIKAAVPKLGLPFELGETVAYDPQAQDYSGDVARLRSAKPDLLLLVTRRGEAIRLTRDMARAEFQPKAIMSPGLPGLYDAEFFKAVGPSADYLISNLPWANPKAKLTQALEASFRANDPTHRFALESLNAGFTFEALLVAANAYKRAGSTEAATLMKAIKSTNIKDHAMTGGPIAFNEKGDNVNVASVCVENLGQTPTVVFPGPIATAKPILPMPPWQGRK